MDNHLIFNRRVVTHNKLQGMNPMLLSAPWDDYLDSISLQTVKKLKR